MNYVQDAFRKLSVDSNPPITVKQEQEKAVNSLINGKNVNAIMPTGFAKEFYFQLFFTAVELTKLSGEHTEVGRCRLLLTGLLTSAASRPVVTA